MLRRVLPRARPSSDFRFSPDDGAIASVERAGDVERLGQVAAGGIQVARPQLVVTEVAEQRPRQEPVTGLAGEPQGLSIIAGRTRRVTLNVRSERPGGKQAGGQVRFSEAAGQA